MAAASSSDAAGLKACTKLLTFLLKQKQEIAPFLEPVNFQKWGLLDYPKVVKTPMDLGQVKGRLDRGEYSSPREFKHDVTLVWSNCMAYNDDGSELFTAAAALKKLFEDKYAKMVDDSVDPTRAPTLVDKKMFAQIIYHISEEDLGRVIAVIDHRCEAALKRDTRASSASVEVDVDALDAPTFWAVDALARECVPGGSRRGGGGGGGKGGKGAAYVAAAAAVGGGGREKAEEKGGATAAAAAAAPPPPPALTTKASGGASSAAQGKVGGVAKGVKGGGAAGADGEGEKGGGASAAAPAAPPAPVEKESRGGRGSAAAAAAAAPAEKEGGKGGRGGAPAKKARMSSG